MCRVRVFKTDCYEVNIDGVWFYGPSIIGKDRSNYLLEPSNSFYKGPKNNPLKLEVEEIPMREWPDILKQNIIKRMEEMKNA